MKITKLDISNYCGIKGVVLEFGRRSNILIGINGAGKSAVLRCIATLMSWFTNGLVQSKSSMGHHFESIDINNQSEETTNSICLAWENHGEVAWSLSKGRNSKSFHRKDLMIIIEKLRQAENRPLFAFYPTNRSVLDIPWRIKERHEFDWTSAYDLRLGRGVDFRLFFEWFRMQQEIENSKKVENEGIGQDYEDILLKAVRNAIYDFLPDYYDLRIRFNPLRMAVTRKADSQELDLRQLSDGEKCLLALVGDLARRLALLNPLLPDGRQGAGIVLIDEIELHLHPKWQRMVIGNLEKAFPNCQFILTTHSPQVLSEAKGATVHLLHHTTDQGIKAGRIRNFYGRDSNYLLEVLMNVSERPLDIKNKLNHYFDLIDQGRLAEAEKLRGELDRSIGSDEPELIKADVLLRRKEIIGR